MGTVFLAEVKGSLGFRQTVAVKILDPAQLSGQPDLRDSLFDEANLMSKLQHPNIVQVHQFLQLNTEVSGATFAMAMEYVEGGTLTSALRAAPFGRLPLAAGLAIAHDTATALAYAWSYSSGDDAEPLHMIHRDLKPDNILLTRDGHSKVVDFGIAWIAKGRVVRTKTGVTKGTLAYMSPEQIRGLPLDTRSDLYSLGAILFELVTGKAYIGSEESRPLDLGAIIFRVSSIEFADRRDLLRGILTAPLGSKGHGLSEEQADLWDALLSDLLVRDVDERIGSSAELLARLDELGTTSTIRNGRAALAEAASPPLSDAVPTNPKTTFSTESLALDVDQSEGLHGQTRYKRKRATSQDPVGGRAGQQNTLKHPRSGPSAIPQSHRRRNTRSLAILAVLVLSLLALVLVTRPVRVDRLTYDDSGSESVGPVLRLEGRHLDKMTGAWTEQWLGALDSKGLVGNSLHGLQVDDGGRTAVLRVTPKSSFDVTELPLPNLPGGAGTLTLPLYFHFKMRVHIFRYKKERHQATVDTFELIRSRFATSDEMKERRTTWAPQLGVTHRPSSEYRSSSNSFLRKEIRQADLIHTSTFLSIRMKWMWIQEMLQHEASGWGGEDSPFSWIACNVGVSKKTHYSSKIVTAEGSWLDRNLPKQETLNPEMLDRLTRRLPKGKSLEFLYGSPGSTSGYAIPCMNWRESLERNASRVHTGHTQDHEDTLRLVLEDEDREFRLGAVYDLMLDERLAEPDFAGAEPRVLWSRERIPHGGIVLRNAMPLAKRRAYHQGFAELLNQQDLGTTIDWPPLGDVIGLSSCIVDKHERFEQSLLRSSQLPHCFEGLHEATHRPPAVPQQAAP